jgi:PKD repeat protein
MPPARTVFFDVTAAPGIPSGPVTLTALVSDPRGITATATFIANVLPPAFTPAAAPSAVTLNAGGSAGTITASLVAGDCIPTSDVTVTPSGLPPGVTVTPASAVIDPPALGPVAFSFQASSSAAPGPSTIIFTFRTGEGLDRTTTAVITVCGPPEAPVSPVVSPQGNPQGPVTATDFLALSWGAPVSGFAPTRYEWRINGGSWNSVAGTSASAPPRGAIDPVQLFVRGFACDPERGPGAEASSPVYSLAAPVASFAVPASIVAGQAVTFTDTSSPQATSWLWFPGDGIPATTVQSPTVTFSTSGPKVIVLVASNGSGSSSKATTINVLPASAVRVATGYAVRVLERESDGRLALGRVEVEPGTTLLLRRLEGEGEAVAYLRFVDADGKVVLERRIVLAQGEEARHDLSAWGATGAFRVELVGPDGLEAAVEEMSIPFGAPEPPVTPRRPGSAAIR